MSSYCMLCDNKIDKKIKREDDGVIYLMFNKEFYETSRQVTMKTPPDCTLSE